MNTLSLFASVALLALGFSAAQAQTAQNAPQSMRFFVTSAGSGKGGDLGGLAGADAHCQSLATAVGAGTRAWHAYLSTQATEGAVNARDRIGRGPWYNAKATLIAATTVIGASATLSRTTPTARATLLAPRFTAVSPRWPVMPGSRSGH